MTKISFENNNKLFNVVDYVFFFVSHNDAP